MATCVEHARINRKLVPGAENTQVKASITGCHTNIQENPEFMREVVVNFILGSSFNSFAFLPWVTYVFFSRRSPTARRKTHKPLASRAVYFILGNLRTDAWSQGIVFLAMNKKNWGQRQNWTSTYPLFPINWYISIYLYRSCIVWREFLSSVYCILKIVFWVCRVFWQPTLQCGS